MATATNGGTKTKAAEEIEMPLGQGITGGWAWETGCRGSDRLRPEHKKHNEKANQSQSALAKQKQGYAAVKNTTKAHPVKRSNAGSNQFVSELIKGTHHSYRQIISSN